MGLGVDGVLPVGHVLNAIADAAVVEGREVELRLAPPSRSLFSNQNWVPLMPTVKSAETSETSLESLTVYWPQSIVSACLIVMVACVRVVVTTNCNLQGLS